MKLKQIEDSLWGQKYKITPYLVEAKWGDGKQFIRLSPILIRPNFYVVRVDSKQELEGDKWYDLLEEIYNSIDEEFGPCCEDYNCQCDHWKTWPATFDWGGSTWSELGDHTLADIGLIRKPGKRQYGCSNPHATMTTSSKRDPDGPASERSTFRDSQQGSDLSPDRDPFLLSSMNILYFSLDSKPLGVYAQPVKPISHFIFPDAPHGPHDGLCALCGFDGPGQYKRDILDITTSNVTALFELAYGYICAPCYGLWSKPKYWHRGLLATEGRVVFPLISVESATDERPTWSQALRALSHDQPRAIVLTTDPKKRVWPFARVSRGKTCSMYIHDPTRGISGNHALSLPVFLSTLNLIERIYSLDFSKAHIATSLLKGQQVAQKIGLTETIRLESELAVKRNWPEFTPALIVAQRQKETNPNESECSSTVSIRNDRIDAARPRRGRRK